MIGGKWGPRHDDRRGKCKGIAQMRLRSEWGRLEGLDFQQKRASLGQGWGSG
jgi:hypothetical protein